MAQGLGKLSVFLELNSARFSAGVDKARTKLGGFRKGLNRTAKSMMSLQGVIGGLVIGSFLKSVGDLEAGMIGVKKTTGLADDEIKKLKGSLLGFAKSNAVTISSLLETAKVAGQMGIQGADSISKFTQAFAKLEIASDRTVAGEFGAQAFAKFLDLSKEGIENAEQLASAMVQLGNTSKTTEGAILSTAEEIVKKTSRFNLGGANILGLATAMEEAGVRSEVAGTSMQMFFEKLDIAIKGNNLGEFSNVFGKTAEEIKRLAKAL